MMFDTKNKACRHACQCNGCKRWGCADDEFLHCEECVQLNTSLCYSYIGVDPNDWTMFCEYHWSKIKHNYGIKCSKCNRKRRITNNNNTCLQCFKQSN
jgi:hypothetical protein